MRSDLQRVHRFNMIRWTLILGIAIWLGLMVLLKFYGAGHYDSLAVYMFFPGILGMVLVAIQYKCPFCKTIPRGRFIRFIDLNPRACAKCGRSLRVKGCENKS
ncbi:hypothetical protein OKW30_000779 [Paraburkholderia sp. Clong3]